ncbi:hypothetical protein D3C71_1782160 [compost metagenome]
MIDKARRWREGEVIARPSSGRLIAGGWASGAIDMVAPIAPAELAKACRLLIRLMLSHRLKPMQQVIWKISREVGVSIPGPL